MTSSPRLNNYRRLGAAVLIPLIAAGLQWLLWPVIQPFAWFLFYPAIFFSAWLGGRWSGILATLFSALLAIYVFVPPMFSFYLDSPATLFSALIFIIMGHLFSYIFHILKQANRRLDLMAQLQASEASLKRSQAAAQVGHWTWDVRSNRVTWSDEMYRIFGLDPIGFSGDLDEVIRTAIHPDDRAKVEAANTAVSEAGQPAPLEYRVVWPDGTVRTVYALPAEQLRDEQGHIAQLWGIVQDITARKQAEAALQQSELLFSTIFQAGPMGINLIRLADRRCVQINDAFLDMIGYRRDEVLGRTATELNLYVDDMMSLALPVALRTRGGQLRNLDVQVRCKNGQIRDVLTSLDVIHLNGEATVLLMAADITERKQAQRRISYLARLYATLSQVNQTIVRVTDQTELFNAICQVAVDYGEFKLAWIGLYDAASGQVTPVADYGKNVPPEFRQVLDLTQEPLLSSTLAVAILNDQVEVNNDVRQATRSVPWREFAAQLGHQSSAAIPLHRQGQVVGVLNLYAADINFFAVEEEQKLLIEMGIDISYALDALYLEGQRQHAEAALRASETRSRALIEHAPDGIVLVTPNAFTYASPSALRLFGYQQADLFQHRPDELTHPDDLPLVFAALTELLQNPAYKPTLQYRFQHYDGSWRWIESTFSNLLAEPGVEAIVINFRDVTERRQADEALRESEQKYRDLINGMNDTVTVLDFDTTILDVNQAATDVLGYTREELLSMKITAIDGALTRAEIQSLVDALPGDQRQVFQTWHVTKEGRRLPVEVSSSLVSYAGRTVIMSIARDITERQQAAEALAESEAKFRSYIEDSSVGIFVVNALGQYIEDNQAAQDLLGYTADELLHLNIAEVVADEDRADALRTFADLVAGQPLMAEYRLKHRAGQLVWVSLRATKLSDDRYIGFCSDITARKQAEAALQQSEEQYRFLVDNTSDFIARFDPTGVLVFASGAAYRFNGYLPEELIHTSAFERIHPDDQNHVRSELSHVLGTDAVGHVEYRLKRKSGDYIWVEAAGRQVVNPAGEPELIVVQRDITDRKRVEEQLRQSQAQLLKFAAQVPGMLYQFEMRPDGSFCVPFTTAAIRDIFGCSPEDVRDDFSPVANVIHPDDQPKIMAAIQTSARDLSPFYIEYRVILPGQPPRWIQAHSMPEKFPNGSIVWSGFNTDVSERNAVERALAASEERHQQFITQSFEAIYRTEFDHPIDTSLPVDEQIDLIYAYAYMAECNQAMAAMYNLASSADMIGSRLIDAHGGKDNPVNRAVFEKFIKAGYKALNDETVEFTVDGQPVWFLSNTVGIVENGQLVRMWGTSLDITARKQAEATNRRTREQLAAVVEIEHALAASLDLGVLYTTLQAGVRRLFPDVNTLFISDFDAEREQIIAAYGWHEGQPVDVTSLPPLPLAPPGQGTQSQVIHSRQPLIIADGLEQRLRPGQVVVIGDRAGGDSRSALYVPMLVQDKVLGLIHIQSKTPDRFSAEDVRVLTLVANTAAASIQNARLYELAQREIVERKLRERELEAVAEVSAALRAASTSADMLAVVVEHAQNLLNGTAASIAFDLPATSEVQIVLARGHWAAITGLRVPRDSSVTGSVILSGQPYVNGDVRADDRMPPHETLAATPAVAVVPLTEQVGTIGTLAVGRAAPITPGEVRVVQAIADIAANALHRASIVENLEQLVVERTQKLAAANEQLTELDRLKSKFVSDVSHELRTPVTSLSLYIDLLEHGKPEKRERYVTGLKEQMARLHKLINDILDLSRLERDRDEGGRSPVDINSIVEHVTATQLMAAEAAGLQLTCEVGDNLPAVVARPDQLTRAITNVVSNAIKYTPTGSVRVQTAEHAGRVCIEVTDTGRGIPADEVPHLFERFYRGRDVAQSTIPGTGLGLSIVKEIIESHGGTVDVQSELGQGSTFFIWLPVA